MRVRRTLSLSIALLLAALAPAASQESSANVAGVWTGTFAFGGGEQRSAYLKLEQKNSEITGTAGPDAGAQLPIANGKVATVNGVTTVTFEVAQPDGPPLKFELQVVSGRLKGKATAEANGQKRDATVDVGRPKPTWNQRGQSAFCITMR